MPVFIGRILSSTLTVASASCCSLTCASSTLLTSFCWSFQWPPSEVHCRPFLTDLFAALESIGQPTSWDSLSQNSCSLYPFWSFICCLFMVFLSHLSLLSCWYYQSSVFVLCSHSSYFNWWISFYFIYRLISTSWWFLNLPKTVFQNLSHFILSCCTIWTKCHKGISDFNVSNCTCLPQSSKFFSFYSGLFGGTLISPVT